MVIRRWQVWLYMADMIMLQDPTNKQEKNDSPMADCDVPQAIAITIIANAGGMSLAKACWIILSTVSPVTMPG